MTDSVNEEAFAEAWSFDTAREYRLRIVWGQAAY
jgi:hypothetical protein